MCRPGTARMMEWNGRRGEGRTSSTDYPLCGGCRWGGQLPRRPIWGPPRHVPDVDFVDASLRGHRLLSRVDTWVRAHLGDCRPPARRHCGHRCPGLSSPNVRLQMYYPDPITLLASGGPCIEPKRGRESSVSVRRMMGSRDLGDRSLQSMFCGVPYVLSPLIHAGRPQRARDENLALPGIRALLATGSSARLVLPHVVGTGKSKKPRLLTC